MFEVMLRSSVKSHWRKMRDLFSTLSLLCGAGKILVLNSPPILPIPPRRVTHYASVCGHVEILITKEVTLEKGEENV